jgi:hypothetical protein
MFNVMTSRTQVRQIRANLDRALDRWRLFLGEAKNSLDGVRGSLWNAAAPLLEIHDDLGSAKLDRQLSGLEAALGEADNARYAAAKATEAIGQAVRGALKRAAELEELLDSADDGAVVAAGN